MSEARVKAWRFILAVVFVGFGITVWWGLEALEPRAKWLEVSAPHRARFGQPFPIRVHLEPQQEARFLTADLHWAKTHDRSEFYLSTDGARTVEPTGGNYNFTLPIPPRAGLRFIQVVLYLSRDGNWDTSTRVAHSEFIEVTTEGASVPDTQLIPLRMADGTPGSLLRPPGKWPHLLTGSVFAVAAALTRLKHKSSFQRGSKSRSKEATPGPTSGWYLSLAAIWELLAAPVRIDAFLRETAHRQDLYYFRGVVQKLAISLVLPAAVWLLWQARKAPSSQRLFFLLFSLYGALTAIDLVSLHAVDQVFERSWQGINLGQFLNLACATLLLQQTLVKPRSPSS